MILLKQTRHTTVLSLSQRLHDTNIGAYTTTSLAQRIHSALDACSELLGYSHLSALELVVRFINLVLKLPLFFEEILEVY